VQRAKSARTHYREFKLRNSTNYRDIYQRVKREAYEKGSTAAKEAWEAARNAKNAVLNSTIGTYHVVRGIGSMAYGVARHGAKTLKHGQNKFARMRYNHAVHRLQNCVDCTPEERRLIQADIDVRRANIVKEETAKRDYLLKEAEEYGKRLSPEEAYLFYGQALEQIEEDYRNALK
jgi:hypothetical protein